MGKDIRIVVAGRSPLIRLGLTQSLSGDEGATVLEEVDDLSKLAQTVMLLKPDVVLFENSFAWLNTVETIEAISATSGTPILVIVADDAGGKYIKSVLDAGAVGYLLSSDPLEALLPSIHQALNEDANLPERFSQILMNAANESDRASHLGIDRLSERELQIFELIGCGYNTKEISDRLHISTKTVETHRRHTREKLDTDTTSELLRLAISWVIETRPLEARSSAGDYRRKENELAFVPSPVSATPSQPAAFG